MKSIPRNRPSRPAKYWPADPGPIQRMLDNARSSLEAKFQGISTDGAIVPGLFPIRRTGVSVQPIIAAANAFIASLTPAQREVSIFGVDSEQWRAWSNIHPYLMRHGVCLDDIGEAQKAAALELVRATTSAAGFESARNVMKLNEHILELTGKTEDYGEWYYWMSIFGEPSATDPWGWQIDGHHLIINCFVLGDQMVMTPNFFGSEPVEAETGKYAGVRVFEEEESRGYELMRSLSEDQRRKATVSMKLPGEVIAGAFKDNLVLACEGIRYGELEPRQQQLLLGLIETYVGRMRSGHAEIKMEEVRQHLPQTWFAWMGPCDEVSPFYYRVQSPVIIIEFDHQSGVALGNDEHSRNHIHTVVRTPNGNDYGKDLLRQHYEQFDHSHPHSPHRMGRV